jgi:hypothetical protein
MKILLCMVLGLTAGVAFGYGYTWYEVGDINEQFRVVNRPPVIDVSTDGKGPGVEVVGGEIYNFGIMGRLGKRDHTFVIRNVGSVPVTLEQGETTCKCTISELAAGLLEPGGEVEVRLEWTAKESEPDSKDFEQTAEILTNDPRRRTIRLTIIGKIIQSVWSQPRNIILSSVTQGNGATASTLIYTYKSDNLEIVDHQFYFSQLEGFLDVRFEEISAQELARDPDARSGKKMILQLKPKLPLGRFNEAIRITTNLRDSPRIDVAIQGVVTPDITFLPKQPNFRGPLWILDLGNVSQEKGIDEKITLLAKGPLRDSIKLSVVELDPAGIFQVKVVRRPVTGAGNAIQHLVQLHIPPGSPQIIRLNEQQDGYGRIVLATTHPDIERLEILVRFAIVPTNK